MWKILLMTLGLFLLPLACGGGSRSVQPPPQPPPPAPMGWSEPQCAAVSGSSFLTYSRDGGVTITPNEFENFPPESSTFVLGLLVSDEPDLLYAVVNSSAMISEDAGCSWEVMGTISSTGAAFKLVPAPGGEAYGYTLFDAQLLHFSRDTGLTNLRAPTARIHHMTAPMEAAGTVLLISREDGLVYRSQDEGATWLPQGVPIPNSDLFNFAVFDPNDEDHLLGGTAGPDKGENHAGFWVSFDGGGSWQQAEGFGGDRIIGFAGAVSPVDGNLVWALGLNLTEFDNGGTVNARYIYRSLDGGRNFQAVIQADNRQVTLTNGTPLFAHAQDTNQLYFSHADSLQENTSDLYHFDNTTGTVTRRRHVYSGAGEFLVLAFHPENHDLIYLGRSFQNISF